jgi:hypothetical protein
MVVRTCMSTRCKTPPSDPGEVLSCSLTVQGFLGILSWQMLQSLGPPLHKLSILVCRLPLHEDASREASTASTRPISCDCRRSMRPPRSAPRASLRELLRSRLQCSNGEVLEPPGLRACVRVSVCVLLPARYSTSRGLPPLLRVTHMKNRWLPHTFRRPFPLHGEKAGIVQTQMRALAMRGSCCLRQIAPRPRPVSVGAFAGGGPAGPSRNRKPEWVR